MARSRSRYSPHRTSTNHKPFKVHGRHGHDIGFVTLKFGEQTHECVVLGSYMENNRRYYRVGLPHQNNAIQVISAHKVLHSR